MNRWLGFCRIYAGKTWKYFRESAMFLAAENTFHRLGLFVVVVICS